MFFSCLVERLVKAAEALSWFSNQWVSLCVCARVCVCVCACLIICRLSPCSCQSNLSTSCPNSDRHPAFSTALGKYEKLKSHDSQHLLQHYCRYTSMLFNNSIYVMPSLQSQFFNRRLSSCKLNSTVTYPVSKGCQRLSSLINL